MKKVIVTRNGLTNCPSCMSHINLASELEQTECPFCHTNLVIERRQDNGTFGRNTLQTLKKSRSAMLAAALGASLSMTACGEKDDNNTPYQDMSVDMAEDMPEFVAMYGAPPADMAVYGAPAVDMEVDQDEVEDMPEVVAMYGGPPVDMDFQDDMD